MKTFKKCIYCRRVFNTPFLDRVTKDHMVPKSRGGRTGLPHKNVYPCCETCNGLKGNKLLHEWLEEIENNKYTYQHVKKSSLVQVLKSLMNNACYIKNLAAAIRQTEIAISWDHKEQPNVPEIHGFMQNIFQASGQFPNCYQVDTRSDSYGIVLTIYPYSDTELIRNRFWELLENQD